MLLVIALAEERTLLGRCFLKQMVTMTITAPATAEAKEWDGWGTALKPAHEPIVMARKPLDGTVANNVLTYGVGGINIDGCRVGDEVLMVGQCHGFCLMRKNNGIDRTLSMMDGRFW
jgi:hypothetical protein